MAAMVRGVRRVAKAEEGIPFVLKDAHYGGIESSGIARPKRHDSDEGILFVIGPKKASFG
jgi:hypothetical protein